MAPLTPGVQHGQEGPDRRMLPALPGTNTTEAWCSSRRAFGLNKASIGQLVDALDAKLTLLAGDADLADGEAWL
ncbi:MAG: hypothetical protein ACRDYY_05185 [Acidimicrobiales bacterium]